jgi:hypothetical protein
VGGSKGQRDARGSISRWKVSGGSPRKYGKPAARVKAKIRFLARPGAPLEGLAKGITVAFGRVFLAPGARVPYSGGGLEKASRACVLAPPGSLALAVAAQGRRPGWERWRSSRSLCFSSTTNLGSGAPFVLYGRFGRFLVGTLRRHRTNTGRWPTRAFFQNSGDPSEASEPSELRAPLRPQWAFGLRGHGERQRAWGRGTEARWGRVAQPAVPRRCDFGFLAVRSVRVAFRRCRAARKQPNFSNGRY